MSAATIHPAQASRNARALAEYRRYRFRRLADGAVEVTGISCKIYVVSGTSCTCADARNRPEVVCKHALAVQLHEADAEEERRIPCPRCEIAGRESALSVTTEYTGPRGYLTVATCPVCGYRRVL